MRILQSIRWFTQLLSLAAAMGRRDIDAQIAHAKALLRIESDEPFSLRVLANALFQKGRFSEAYETMLALSRIEPQNPEYFFALAEMARQLGDEDAIRQHLEQASALIGAERSGPVSRQ